MSEIIICDECKKIIADETYIKVEGNHLKRAISDGGPWTAWARQKALKDAIEFLKYKPNFFKTKYIGIKNYECFGDQREDHDIGMGPRHGSIVFRIFLKDKFRDGELSSAQKDVAIKHLSTLFKQTVQEYGLGCDL